MFGAFILIAMESYLSQYGSWITIIQGVIFIVCVLAFRQGLVGEFERLRELFGRMMSRRRGAQPAGLPSGSSSSDCISMKEEGGSVWLSRLDTDEGQVRRPMCQLFFMKGQPPSYMPR